MKQHRFALILAGLAIFASLGSAATINVSGSSKFDSSPTGILANWTHNYSSGSPDVSIEKIKINLNSNVFFDLTIAPPGYLIWQSFGTTSGGGTGFSGFSVESDGSMSVELNFTGFNPGESYMHVGDVDEYQHSPCARVGLLGLAACLLNSQLDGSLVTGDEFAGSTVEVTLGGPMVAYPVTLTGTFLTTGHYEAIAHWSGTVEVDDRIPPTEAVPEPSSWMMAGCGVAMLVGRRAFRR
jgi:hypothetical protein